jgi:hypothetical protein
MTDEAVTTIAVGIPRTSLRDVRAPHCLTVRMGAPEPEEFDTSESDEDIAAPGAGHGAGCRPTDIADGIGDRDIVDEADIQTTGAIAIPL